jgi:integrase
MNSAPKIVLRQPARQDGTCLIRLQVILNRKVLPIGLNIAWWPELFDEAAGSCLASVPVKHRKPGYAAAVAAALAVVGPEPDALATKAAAYNLIIGQARGKANQVLVDAHLSRSPLTVEGFLLEYNSEASKDDFLDFYERKLLDRRKRGRIEESTYISHNATLVVLRNYVRQKARTRHDAPTPPLPFYAFNHSFADDFHDFLKTVSKGANTWWGRHKNVKTYLNFARKAKIKFENPYQYFKNKAVPGSWLPLKPWELEELEAYYLKCLPGTADRRVLQKFLFSCYSSLRLSDLKAINKATFDGREMTFQIKKTYSAKLRDMLLPLTTRAIGYLEDARRENDTPGFHDYADQYSNRVLQRIAAHLDLVTHVHHHVGRETFATNFVRAGGAVEVLQKLMDHESINTTMKYVHVDNEMKRAAIQAMDTYQQVNA